MEARECLHRHLGDISAYLPRYYPPQFVHYLKTYGREEVLFGTNFHYLSWARLI